jgi:hypothetical protein
METTVLFTPVVIETTAKIFSTSENASEMRNFRTDHQCQDFIILSLKPLEFLRITDKNINERMVFNLTSRLTSGKCLRQNIFQALNDLENFLHGNRRQVALQTGQWAFRDMIIFMCSDIFPSPQPRVEKFTRALKAIIWSAIRLRSSLNPDLSYLLMAMSNYSGRPQQNDHSQLDQTGRDIPWSIHPTSYVSSASTQSWERLLKLISPTTQAHKATGMDVDDGVARIEEGAIVTDKAAGEPSALCSLVLAMNAKLDHLL